MLAHRMTAIAVMICLAAVLSPPAFAQDRPTEREDDAAEYRDDDHPRPPGHRPVDRDREFHRRPMRERGPGAPRLTPEQIEQRLEILEQLHPELAERLRRQIQEHPDRVRTMMEHHWPRIRHYMELKKSDPEMFELRTEDLRLARRSVELAQQFTEAQMQGKEQEAEELLETLRDNLEEHFEVRQESRERELEKLERRLEEMREKIEQRREAREELIEQQMERLTGLPEHARPEW